MERGQTASRDGGVKGLGAHRDKERESPSTLARAHCHFSESLHAQKVHALDVPFGPIHLLNYSSVEALNVRGKQDFWCITQRLIILGLFKLGLPLV
jgi:hypothetical protein